jgi:hypothetical protein
LHRGDDAGFRDADEEDGLFMFDQLQSGNTAFAVEADDDLDRLSRISNRVGEVRIQVSEAKAFFAFEDGNERRLSLRRPKAICARRNVARANLGDEFGQAACSLSRADRKAAKHKQDGNQKTQRARLPLECLFQDATHSADAETQASSPLVDGRAAVFLA